MQFISVLCQLSLDMNTAIIVAAGKGTRLNAERPKQFLEVLNKPILIHTLDRFEACSSISEVIVVVPVGEIETFTSLAEKFGLHKITRIVAGGSTRAESVANGLTAVDPRTEIVAVHDGARPLVTIDEIERTIEQAKEIGAACLVAAVTDTIKEIKGDKITGTLERGNLRRALTPQAFRYEIIKRAFAGSDLSEDVTDECFLVEKLGYEIAFVEGSSKNIKITNHEDLAVAALFLKDVD